MQRVIMFGASLGYIGLHVIPPLDVRFGWSSVPAGVVIIADVLFAIGFGFVGRVYRANTYTSATVEVTAGQRGGRRDQSSWPDPLAARAAAEGGRCLNT